MLILNEENKTVDLNLIPEQANIYYWTLNNSVPSTPDYFCEPLIALESFYAPVIKLKFLSGYGRNRKIYYVNVPADHQLLIGEPTHGDLEINPITSLSGRDFKAFVLNPLSSFSAEYMPVDIEDALPNIRWYFPKMSVGNLLCVPLREGDKPPCIYVVRDIPKSMEVVLSAKCW
jgi:hypothetical protein